jgi:hypothetical protein
MNKNKKFVTLVAYDVTRRPMVCLDLPHLPDLLDSLFPHSTFYTRSSNSLLQSSH